MLVLASRSPRRRELLAWLGVNFVIDVPDVAEEPVAGERAQDTVRRLSLDKAQAVSARRSDAWVLAADTVVEIDGVLLGKPENRTDARRMLARLSGRDHHVHTGVAFLAPGGAVRMHEVTTSRVRFRTIDDATIQRYVASGECDDKAGAYAIQGVGCGLIAAVDGSFTNVIGLPLEEVQRALAGAGLAGG